MFKVNIEHELGKGSIWVESTQIEESSKIQFDSPLAFYYNNILAKRHGCRGILTDRACPVDLYKAIKNSGVTFAITEGAEILKQSIESGEDGKFY